MSEEEENRAMAPLCAAFIARMREVFELKVIYAKEGDLHRGAPCGPLASCFYFGRGLTFKEYMKELKG